MIAASAIARERIFWVFAIDWTVSLRTLPDSSYMIQFGRGHCDLKVLPIQIDVEAMDCRQQRGSKMARENTWRAD